MPSEVPQFSIPNLPNFPGHPNDPCETYIPNCITLSPGQIVGASFGMMKFDEGAVVFKVDETHMNAQAVAMKTIKKVYYDSLSKLKPLDFDYVKDNKFLIVAAKNDANQSIVRGQVVRCGSDGDQVVLYLLDDGNFGSFSIKDIYAPSNALVFIPIMNLCVILDGLDFFFQYNCENYLRLAMEHAEADGLLVEPFKLKAVKPNPITKSKLKDKPSIPTVVATVCHKGQKINFNKWLIEKCISKSITSVRMVPHIIVKGCIVELDYDGSMYIQLTGSLAENILEYLKQYKMKDFEEVDELHLEDLKSDKTYLAQYEAGGLYRCKPLEPIKPNERHEIKIEYIDWGDYEWRLPQDLVEAHHACRSLEFIPPTAHKVQLANVVKLKQPTIFMESVRAECTDYSFEVTEVGHGDNQTPHVKIIGKPWMEAYFDSGV